jgi:hypothetical protein
MSGPSNETENEKRLERIALALERIAQHMENAGGVVGVVEALETLASAVEPTRHYEHSGTIKAYLRTSTG